MILTSTLWRMELYHKINISLKTEQLLSLPPPMALRRTLSRLCPQVLLPYWRPVLCVLFLNLAKYSSWLLLAAPALSHVIHQHGVVAGNVLGLPGPVQLLVKAPEPRPEEVGARQRGHATHHVDAPAAALRTKMRALAV